MWYLKEKDTFTKSEFLNCVERSFCESSLWKNKWVWRIHKAPEEPEICDAILPANALLFVFLFRFVFERRANEASKNRASRQLPWSGFWDLLLSVQALCCIVQCENTTASRAVICCERLHVKKQQHELYFQSRGEATDKQHTPWQALVENAAFHHGPFRASHSIHYTQAMVPRLDWIKRCSLRWADSAKWACRLAPSPVYSASTGTPLSHLNFCHLGWRLNYRLISKPKVDAAG